jgi:hypothetical protein
MGEKLLDGLARALAEPMPRRRAVRMIGGSLAALAIPGASSSVARAAPHRARHHTGVAGPTRSVTCPIDGQQWVECPDGSCCPKPNVCCSRPSPLSGAFNCCETQAHCCCGNACCDPKSQICICPEPGGVGGACVDRVCGPNLSEALGVAVVWLKREFASWSAVVRNDLCHSLYYIGPIAWDIAELDPANRARFIAQYGPECTTCGSPAVQVGSECHHAGSVNYVVFGAMMRLCHDDTKVVGRSWFSEEAMNLLIVAHKSSIALPFVPSTEAGNLDASIAWAKAGYRGWPNNGRVPPGDRSHCKASCGKPYRGPGLTVRWSYKRIRFPG